MVEGRNPDVKPDPDRPAGGLSAVELDYYNQTTRALFGSNLELLKVGRAPLVQLLSLQSGRCYHTLLLYDSLSPQPDG